MKLKYIEVNGYVVLVDESAEIKTEGSTKDMDWVAKNYPNTDKYFVTKTPLKSLLNADDYKIIFAEKELNLDVPVLPNWREWEVEQKATEYSRPYSQKVGRKHGFMDGFYYNEAKMYTEEDFKIPASKELKEKHGITYSMQGIMAKHIYNHIQSLQKLPQYIVMEGETIKEIIY